MILDRSVPEVRFKGFSNDWNEIELGDIATIKGRLGWKSLKQEEYVKNGPAMIAGRHIKNGAVDWKKVDHIPPWRYLESPEIMLKNGDVIFSKDGSLGNPAVVTELKREATINSTMMLVRPKKNLNANFFYQILKTKKFNDLIKEKVSGSSIPHLFQADMKLFRFVSTSLEEQKKIGNTLQNLDSLINQHQQKHDKFCNIKKAMLEKMFPKQGETIPEIRFKGFNGEWKKKKLAELAEIVRGASPRPIEDPKWFDKNSTVGWLRIRDVTEQDGRIHFLEQRISKLGEEKTRVLFEPHLLLSIAASVGKPVINYVETGVHDGFLIFKKPLFELEFMYQWLKSFQEAWQQYGQPGSQVNLNSDIVKSQVVNIPSNEEQIVIGNYFQKLDSLINQHQQQVTKLKNIKQACLSKMFV
ncbi:restriction endonuclease subunit S [Pseudoalteromonas agarivorans]|uniref:restriction endonuclease subunit S n=1 Tax=Pseudoalteromonas agarivorans TaxID=176102 RepID=UPI00249B95BA|nr:restriction endonuclease subunit S [Pseudoalteromonas agarivorans]MDI3245006.1 restriction endonuclease subunit S [Pseudoalteromonas agarivorans]